MFSSSMRKRARELISTKAIKLTNDFGTGIINYIPYTNDEHLNYLWNLKEESFGLTPVKLDFFLLTVKGCWKFNKNYESLLSRIDDSKECILGERRNIQNIQDI